MAVYTTNSYPKSLTVKFVAMCFFSVGYWQTFCVLLQIRKTSRMTAYAWNNLLHRGSGMVSNHVLIWRHCQWRTAMKPEGIFTKLYTVCRYFKLRGVVIDILSQFLQWCIYLVIWDCIMLANIVSQFSFATMQALDKAHHSHFNQNLCILSYMSSH